MQDLRQQVQGSLRLATVSESVNDLNSKYTNLCVVSPGQSIVGVGECRFEFSVEIEKSTVLFRLDFALNSWRARAHAPAQSRFCYPLLHLLSLSEYLRYTTSLTSPA